MGFLRWIFLISMRERFLKNWHWNKTFGEKRMLKCLKISEHGPFKGVEFSDIEISIFYTKKKQKLTTYHPILKNWHWDRTFGEKTILKCSKINTHSSFKGVEFSNIEISIFQKNKKMSTDYPIITNIHWDRTFGEKKTGKMFKN